MAAFTVIGAIALQGIRLVQPTLGEAVVVTGLGLVGLLTVQLLRAHGCRVLGLDFDPSRVEQARRFGAEAFCVAGGADPVAAATAFSRGRGVDAVIVTASTKSSEPMHQAALMCRKRGRIVLVGVTGLELSRADFYEKELTFQVSCSYGPGRYDPAYEERGQDYPFGFVRWTEQRNLEAVLDMLADRRLDVDTLITHRFPVDEAPRAYEVVGGAEPSLGILMEYPAPTAAPTRTVALGAPLAANPGSVGVSVVGSGNYASAVLVPAFAAAGASLRHVASSGGTSSVHVGRTLGFQFATTDVDALLADAATSLVVVSTRHDSHADQVVRALEAGKHLFVEKPLAMTDEGVDRIEAAVAKHPGRLVTVGFNRRFAPHVVKAKELLQTVPGPLAMTMTVNAGAIPANHWTQDREVGGGRIIGEACHFIDLLRHLAGAPIAAHQAIAMDGGQRDSVVIQLRFENGSIGSIQYLANGHKAVAKERLEIFANGRILQLDNFRELNGHGWPGFSQASLWRQDKGQLACARAIVEAVRHGGAWPIPLAELLEVARVTLAIDRSLA
jgi:predicted dehydrogenase